MYILKMLFIIKNYSKMHQRKQWIESIYFYHESMYWNPVKRFHFCKFSRSLGLYFISLLNLTE